MTNDLDPTAPYAGFGGRIATNFAKSQPDWPSRPLAPSNAPNVVVIMVDDLGYSDAGCYGSEIPTPNIDKLAANGIRYTNFHVNPMCSPTRASLLTGLQAHDAGVGYVAECDPGYPGYAGEMTQNAATLAELFRDNGYATLMSGKWHLTRPANKNPAGDKSGWPVQRGFDEYYGILNGFTNFHHPDRLLDGNSVLDIDDYPEGYYLTDDLTDRAIRMIRGVKVANPAKPFFLYMAHPAVHAPLQAKAEDIARHDGRYDQGWDALRTTRFARQKELGILPQAALPPRNPEQDHDVEAWDSLSANVKKLYARYMEVYAGMVDNVDQNIGRLIGAIEQLGQLDNTIVLFTSDNGASREGEATGSTQYFEILPPALKSNVERDLALLDKIGSAQTTPHYPRGWAMACNTPLRMYKTMAHAAAHQVPLIVHWPDGVAQGHIDAPGSLRTQYAHVTDIMPTLLELTGLDRPATRNGHAMKALAGASLTASFAKADAPHDHPEQAYECQGHRAMYRDGWEAVTVHYRGVNFADEPWELFNLTTDPSQATDLAADHPDRLEDLKTAWHDAAERYQIYPLDEGLWVKMMEHPAGLEVHEEPVTVYPDMPSLEHWRAGRLIQMRHWTATISLDYAAGDQGVLVAHGDQGGGYSMFVEDDQLVWCANDFGTTHHIRCGPMPQGPTEIQISSTPDASTYSVAVALNGEHRADAGPYGALLGIAPFQGIDVGIDRRSPVSWDMHQRHGTFRWTGTLHHVRYEPGPYASGRGPQVLDTLKKMAEKYD